VTEVTVIVPPPDVDEVVEVESVTTSTFGFGGGTDGAFGFPVDVFDPPPEVDEEEDDEEEEEDDHEVVVEVVEVDVVVVVSSVVVSVSLPPGRVMIEVLASFSAASAAALAAAI